MGVRLDGALEAGVSEQPAPDPVARASDPRLVRHARAITLAALLAVPTTTKAGATLAGRNDIIYLGFAKPSLANEHGSGDM